MLIKWKNVVGSNKYGTLYILTVPIQEKENLGFGLDFICQTILCEYDRRNKQNAMKKHFRPLW